MGSGSINEIGIGSFTIYSVDENGNTEYLGTLDGIESIEAIVKTEPEEEDKAKMTFSLLEPHEMTFTAKLTLWTRIKLRLWWWKSKVQKWWTYRKFKRSFDKAAKEQEKFERRIHRG